MSDIFGISISALQAFQAGMNVASNNIANINTPGYSKESINLVTGVPQGSGAATVGSGVLVDGITRSFNQATANQLNSSQSSLGQLNALQSYSSQIDNMIGTTAGGLSTVVQGYYSAWSDVANSPTSTAARQALIGKAQSVAASFQNKSSQLNALNTDINSRITSDVQQINADAASISKLNAQIVIASAEGGGQPPNDLIDQRDQLVTNLSKLTGITTSLDGNGALNVFVGNGQPLVLQGNTTQLTTAPNPFNASQLEISTSTSNGNTISGSITSGDLGGLLTARNTVINPALNQLGQIATAFAQSANQQQNAGADLSQNLGAALFSVAGPQAIASSKNTDAGKVTATVTVPGIGGLTANDYVLSYQSGAYSLTNTTDGSVQTPSGSGTVASPLTAAGLSIVLSFVAPATTPAAGDQFLIQPTRQAAASFSAVLNDPSKIAAAGISLPTAAGSANAGSGTIGAAIVANSTTLLTAAPATIKFTSPTTYTVTGVAGSNTYTPGGNIIQNGWQVQISGTPANGDTFTVNINPLAIGDNSNALANANQQTQPVLDNSTVSINDAVSALVTGVGSQAQQINTAQTAQAAVNAQAVATQQSVSGVNLDEEAASLLQWQQAYGAAAKALQIGSGLFTSLLAALH